MWHPSRTALRARKKQKRKQSRWLHDHNFSENFKLQIRSRPVRSNTKGMEKCNPMKPMRKSQTLSNVYKVSEPSAMQHTTKELSSIDKLMSQPQSKYFVNEKTYSDNPQQHTREDTICQTKSKMQKKESSVEYCHDENVVTEGFVLRNGLHEYPKASGTNLLHPGYLNLQQVSCPTSDRSSNQNMTCAPYQRESLEKLFLDLDLVELQNEDEDSASDLSDSERLPIPPSPLAPPEMNLPAEEISPEYFSLYVQPKGEVYSYPDFLPPPYNSWNLTEISTFLNKEGKNTLKAMPSRFLERYIDRLLQLEWLQLQTGQVEKAKPVKSRPQTARGLYRNGKFLGKSKSWHSSSPTKQNYNSDNICKMTCTPEKSYHRKYPHRELSDLTCAHKTPPKVHGSVDLPSPIFRQTQDMKAVTKSKSILNNQQARDTSAFGNSSKMYSTGNLRPPKQSPLSNYSPSTPRQAKSCKLKKINYQSSPISDTDHSAAKQNGKSSQSPSYKMKSK